MVLMVRGAGPLGMKMQKKFFLVLFCLGLFLGAPLLAEEELLPERALKAQGILMPFKKDLKAALLAGLEQGPANAIGACNLAAPEILKALEADGIRIGRTSHRLRNPKNAPQDWMKPFLESYPRDGGVEARWIELQDGSFGYVEPIYLQPLCLTCHGEDLPEEVSTKIKTLYPEDQSTGFKEGDFRGLFWVLLRKEG